MLSLTIAKHLESSIPELTLGENLFAETGSGTKNIVVGTTYSTHWAGMPIEFRQSNLQIALHGYAIQEGYDLAELIVGVIDPMLGEYSDGTSVYRIDAVNFINLPTLAKFNDNSFYTMNIMVRFVVL